MSGRRSGKTPEELTSAIIALREQGFNREEIARAINMSPSRVSQLVPLYHNSGKWKKVYALLMEQKLTTREIAETVNCNIAHVYYVKHRYGLTLPPPRGHDGWVKRRGFSIPGARKTEYHSLRRLGLTPQEAGWEMGLLARPELGAGAGKIVAKPKREA